MKRLDGKSVAGGIAVGLLLWGLFNGSFDGGDAPDMNLEESEPPLPGESEMPSIPAPTPMPEPMPTPAPEPVPQAAAPAAPAPAAPQAATVQPTTGMPAGSGILEWFGKLSPGAQKVIAQGTAGGAAGLMSALAQRNAQKDADDRAEDEREDKRRRGAIPAIGNGFIQRTRGI